MTRIFVRIAPDRLSGSLLHNIENCSRPDGGSAHESALYKLPPAGVHLGRQRALSSRVRRCPRPRGVRGLDAIHTTARLCDRRDCVYYLPAERRDAGMNGTDEVTVRVLPGFFDEVKDEDGTIQIAGPDGQPITFHEGDVIKIPSITATGGKGFEIIESDVDTDEEAALKRADEEIARIEARKAERDRQDRLSGYCKDLPLSDVGNAERLVKRHGQNLLYCHPWKKWYIWDGTRWAPDDTGKIMRLAKDTAMRIGDEAHAAGGSSDLYKWAGTSQSHPRINAMAALTQSEVPVLPAALDANPNLITFPNGTLELDTFTFREHKREDRCTKAMGCEYLPDATCPQWETFLNEIFERNTDLIKFVQRALGYSLTTDTKERAIFLCHGMGANGKSTLLNTVATAMGEYAKQAEANSFCQQRHDNVRNDLAALKGARYVTANEAGKNKRLDEELIKQLTGATDTISCRFLFQEMFEYRPQFKIWWAFNHKPEIRDGTLSIWDRVKLIPFNYRVKKIDKNLPEKLLKELPGIVNWMCEGLREYHVVGLKEPDVVKIATEEYKIEQDRLYDFREKVLIEDPSGVVFVSVLYKEYLDYCEIINEKKPMGKNAFSNEMAEKYVRDRDSTGRYFKGITLKAQPSLNSENQKLQIKEPDAK